MNLKTVHGEQTHTVTENVQVVLVISLTLVEETDFKLFFALICRSNSGILKNIFKFLVVAGISSFVIGVLDKLILVNFFNVILLLVSVTTDLLD